MKCKDCGAHLPYGAYGSIKCEYCGAPNYVPIPGEKVEDEVERAPEPAKAPPKEIKGPVAPTPPDAKKGISTGMILLLIIAFVGVGVYMKSSSQPDSHYPDEEYDRLTPERTSRPEYTPLETTAAQTQEPAAQETSKLEGRDALELLPTKISNYETIERKRFSKSGCRSAARAVYDVDSYGSKVVVEVCEVEDTSEYLNRLHKELVEDHGVYRADFMDTELIHDINAKYDTWFHQDAEQNVALYYWVQKPFVFEVMGYSDPLWSGWHIIIAESVAERIIYIQ